MVGSPLFVDSEDGEKVYQQIQFALKEERSAILSFFNIKTLTPTFLNAAIGQVYGEFSEEQIQTNLQVSEIELGDLFLLKRVVNTAKSYFKNCKITVLSTNKKLLSK
jgi:hypothetical protein